MGSEEAYGLVHAPPRYFAESGGEEANPFLPHGGEKFIPDGSGERRGEASRQGFRREAHVRGDEAVGQSEATQEKRRARGIVGVLLVPEGEEGFAEEDA